MSPIYLLQISESISPGKWIELLTDYGPMALFVFMVFVLLPVARSMSGLSQSQKRTQNLAYRGVWLSILALGIFIVLAWWQSSIRKEYVARGRITNLTYPEIITTDEELFLHRHPVAGLDFEYDWRWIRPDRFVGTVELLLQKNPKDVKVLSYKLPIRNEFYNDKTSVEVEYNKDNDEMILKYGVHRETLSPSTAQIAQKESPEASDPAVVYAMATPQPSPTKLILALDVDDPLIRQAARRDLVRLGSTALPGLSDALVDPKSSYRLRVEVLTVLSEMGAPANHDLSEAGRCAVLRATNDGDQTISEEAKALVNMGIKPLSNCVAVGLPQSIRPIGLAFLPSGLVVLDEYSECVSQIRPGELQTLIKLGAVQGIDIATLQDAQVHGKIFVITAPKQGRPGLLQMYSNAGVSEQNRSAAQSGGTAFSALAVDPTTNSVYLAAATQSVVEILRIDLNSGGRAKQQQPIFLGQIFDPQSPVVIGAIAVDRRNGRLFAADKDRGMLYMATLPLDGLTRIRPQRISLPHSLDNARALAVSAGGDVLYAAAGSHVWKLRIQGLSAQIQDFGPTHTFRSPSALTIAPSGSLWVGDEETHAVYEISPDGKVLTSLHG